MLPSGDASEKTTRIFMGEGKVVPSKCCAVLILLTNRKDLIGPGSAQVFPQIILGRFSTLLFQSRNWKRQNITGANWLFSDGLFFQMSDPDWVILTAPLQEIRYPNAFLTFTVVTTSHPDWVILIAPLQEIRYLNALKTSTFVDNRRPRLGHTRCSFTWN